MPFRSCSRWQLRCSAEPVHCPPMGVRATSLPVARRVICSRSAVELWVAHTSSDHRERTIIQRAEPCSHQPPVSHLA